ncbi:anti-repressor SinI family protein [Virgibacillus kimchii]
MQSTVKKIALDDEWVRLIKSAKTLGITTEEIREFLEEAEKNGGG